MIAEQLFRIFRLLLPESETRKIIPSYLSVSLEKNSNDFSCHVYLLISVNSE